MLKKVLIIGGPTASGKSALALAVARAAGGTVINADSMQLYRGLPLLTAQPDTDDMAAAPHRLYGVLAADDICSSARWRQMALEEIDKADDLPILTGGSGFYIKTLLEGLSDIPPLPEGARAEAIALQQSLGTQGLFDELQRRDSATAAKIDPMNTQRVTRAMEVLIGSGRGLADWQSQPKEAPPSHLTFITVTLIPPRDKLYTQCDQRFLTMLDMGAVEEAEKFRKSAPAASPLDKALGYDAICDFIDGKISRTDMIASGQQATRNYAKRQTTWFKNQLTPDVALETADILEILALL